VTGSGIGCGRNADAGTAPADTVPVPRVRSSLIESQNALPIRGNLSLARVAGRNESVVPTTFSLTVLPRNGTQAQRGEDSCYSRCYERFGGQSHLLACFEAMPSEGIPSIRHPELNKVML
jgi:hypothetical protein